MTNALYAEVWQVGALVYNLVGVTSAAISAAVLMVGAVVISPAMAFAALLVAMLMGLIFRSRYRKQRAIVKEKIAVQAEVLGGVVDVFDGYRTIRLAGAETTFADRLGELFGRTTRWRVKNTMNQAILITFSQAFVYVIMLVVVVAAVLFTADVGGRALVILVLMQRILSSVGIVQQDWLKVQSTAGAADKVMSLLEQCGVQDVAARPEPTGAPAEPVRHIVLENICFAYDDGEDLYTGVNMELRAGDWVLLKGRSGIGKSTLALLACGMLQPMPDRPTRL